MIEPDYDYVGAFLFESQGRHGNGNGGGMGDASAAVMPNDLISQGSPYDGLAEAPPPISGYRDANVAGMACWNCGHFTAVDDADNDGIVDGVCNLYEARAEGECTCDKFTAHADLFRQSPHTSWAEDMMDSQSGHMGPSVERVDYSDSATLNEIRFSGTGVEEENGLVWKDILRTGEWSHMPTNQGVLEKKLRIVRDGESDPANGVISLAEILKNYEEGAVPYVTVPLSDDKEDHKNIARVNTGLVRKLKLVDRNGQSFLRAGIDFTEPEVKERVLRGTIPDCSAGVPFGVKRRRDNRFFKAVLDHVALVRKPFIDGLGPFGMMAADDESADLPVETWEEEEVTLPAESARPEPAPEAIEGTLSFRELQAGIRNALSEQMNLAQTDYLVEDVSTNPSVAIVRHRSSNVAWDVPYKLLVSDGKRAIRLGHTSHWHLREGQTEQEPESVAASDPKTNELKNAHELRELRLAQPTATGGINMSVSAPLSLDGLELSDEARQRIQGIIEENERLARQNRESSVAERISELEGLGLSERPGALKFYRQIMLSDDGGPAVILFSDSDDDTKKKPLTAIEVLDYFINALHGDGGVHFSDQALRSGNDNKPPLTTAGEKKAIDERVKEANQALYGNESGPQRRRRPTTAGK